MTWLLVSTSPFEVTTIPVPAAGPSAVWVSMSTSPGSILRATAAAAAEGAEDVPPGDVPEPPFWGSSCWKPPPKTELPFEPDAVFEGHSTCESAAPPKAASATTRTAAASSERAGLRGGALGGGGSGVVGCGGIGL